LSRFVNIESLEARAMFDGSNFYGIGYAEDSQTCGPGFDVSPDAPGNSMGSDAGGYGASGIQVAGGKTQVVSDFPSSDGFGTDFGAAVSWTNATTVDGIFGKGMSNPYQPTLEVFSSGSEVHVSFGSGVLQFVNSGGTYLPKYHSNNNLTYSSGSQEYVFTDVGGRIFKFSDSTGKIKSFADAFGNTINYTYAGGQLDYVIRSQGGTDEKWDYTYISGGDNNGLVDKIDFLRGANTVRTVDYDFYTGSQAHLLKSVSVKDGGGAVLDTTYYRYYYGSTDGYDGALKMILTPKSYAQATLALGAISDTTTDANLSVYADQYYKYDGSKRVTQLVQQGLSCSVCSGSGLGTFGYTYTTSGFDLVNYSNDYNVWKYKTEESLPDGNKNIFYTNYAGQTILKVFVENPGTNQKIWETFYKYDDNGRVILKAEASALTGYDENYEDLINPSSGSDYFSDSVGLVSTYSYYASTTASSTTAGGAKGYLYETYLQRGESGATVDKQTQYKYFAHQSTFPLAESSVYRDDDATYNHTTTYLYTYHQNGSETNQIQQVTVTRPLVDTSQNGSGVTEQDVTVFDTNGRPIWQKDAAGFMTYTEYDNKTGAVTKIIRDVNTGTGYSSTYSNKPSTGWDTPNGGGLHLTTAFMVDDFGRTTKMTDPKGYVTYTVYKDASHEVRTYAGWDSNTNLPTGPVTVIREQRGVSYAVTVNGQSVTRYGSFNEVLTYSITSGSVPVTSGVPTGAETFSQASNPGTKLETLTRQLVNAGGQLIRTDNYHSFTGVTSYSATAWELPGTSNNKQNFYRTEYSYDHRGRQNRVLDAEGTISRTVYNGQGRVVSNWIGTDDSVTTGSWSPTNAGAMIKLAGNEYDMGADKKDGNLTKQTVYPRYDTAPTDTRVSLFAYDWRNRQVATKSGAKATLSDETTSGEVELNRPVTYTVYTNLNQTYIVTVYDGDGIDINLDSNSNGVPDDPYDLTANQSKLRARTSMDYDKQGRVYQTFVNQVNQSTGASASPSIINSFKHDKRGLVIETVDPRSISTYFEYDGVGRQTKVTTADPDNYGGSNGSLTALVKHTAYDLNGNVEWVVINPSSYSNLASNALVTTYEYDKINRQTKMKQADPSGGITTSSPVTNYTYSATNGWLETISDPLQRKTKYTYDGLGRTVKMELPDPTTGEVGTGNNPMYESTYDGMGNVKTETDPYGKVTTHLYNLLHLKEKTTFPDPDTTISNDIPEIEFTYNRLGEMLTSKDPLARVTSYTYNVLGQQYRIDYPDDANDGVAAAQMTYTFDALGGVTSSKNAAAQATLTYYDGYHRVSKTQLANLEITEFAYDLSGNRTSLKDGTSYNTTTWTYDNLNRVDKETNQLGKVRDYDYDQAGRLSKVALRNLQGDGVTKRNIEYLYDNLNRLTTEKWDGSNVYTWTYDAAGQVDLASDISNGIGSRDFDYDLDKLGRLKTSTFSTLIPQSSGTQSRSFKYENSYDKRGSRTMLQTFYKIGTGQWSTSPTETFDYTYDNLGRQTVIKHSDNNYRYQYAKLSYYKDGQFDLIQRHQTDYQFIPTAQNALAYTKNTYDQTGRLETIKHASDSQLQNLFAGYDYDWDAADRLINVDFLAGRGVTSEDVDYSYDAAGQLTEALRAGNYDESYQYDIRGNRSGQQSFFDDTDKTYTVGYNNQLENDGTYVYTYDNEGNRSSRTKLVSGNPTGEKIDFVWDHRNRMTEIRIKTNAGDANYAKRVAYTYDINDQIVSRWIDADGDGNYTESPDYQNYTDYFFDGQNMHSEVIWYGTSHAFVYGPKTDQLLFEVSDTTYAPLSDHLNSVRDIVKMVSGTATNIEHNVYDAFGRVWSRETYSGTTWTSYAPTAVESKSHLGFTGRYFEANAGLQYNWHRWYDSSVGKWISEDPIGFEGGDANLTRYVSNSPVTRYDSTGLEDQIAINERVKGDDFKDARGSITLENGDVVDIKIYFNATFSALRNGKPYLDENGQPRTQSATVQFEAKSNDWRSLI